MSALSKKTTSISFAEKKAKLSELITHHIDSFNFFIDEGLEAIVANIEPVVLDAPKQPLLKLWWDALVLERPSKGSALDDRLWPHECRERGSSYCGAFHGRLCFQIGDGPVESVPKKLGNLPIMLRSRRCHLERLPPEELAKHKEEMLECGGTFIVNGNEKLIRMLVAPRRHHVCAIDRKAFTNRGPLFTTLATSIRCVRTDESSSTINLHYLTDGTMKLRVSVRKQELFFPVVLIMKAFEQATDREIFEALSAGASAESKSFVRDRVEIMIRVCKALGISSQPQALAYMGQRLRITENVPSSMSDMDVARTFLRRNVFVHLSKTLDKANLLVYMVHKLFDLIQGSIQPDSSDSSMFHEVYLGGFLYTVIVKERLIDSLINLRQIFINLLSGKKNRYGKDISFGNPIFIKKVIQDYQRFFEIGEKLEHFLATGNLQTRTGMDLQQVAGYTIIAERINFLRYLAHFRSIHRGAYFTEMKTTAIRKLLPDSWGYLCPVHTPDGTPCGLLNHLSIGCRIVTEDSPSAMPHIVHFAISLGMREVPQSHLAGEGFCEGKMDPVFLNGKLIGVVEPFGVAPDLVRGLRHAKVMGLRGIPPLLEIAFSQRHSPKNNDKSLQQVTPSTGIFLFSSISRMIRAVTSLTEGKIEHIGSLEQGFLNIALSASEVPSNPVSPSPSANTAFTHAEISPNNMISLIANLTPFSDFNQSPRNMYQCQMAKQTFAIPLHAFRHRGEEKMYMLHTIQKPVVATKTYDDYGLNEYPLGNNAVVAVISYTGFDMEDALILNKSSVERGLGHGSVFKTVDVDLSPKTGRGGGGKDGGDTKSSIVERFCNRLPSGEEICDSLNGDGLPSPGQMMTRGSPLYVTVNCISGKAHIKRFTDSENAYVDCVLLLGGKPVSSASASASSSSLAVGQELQHVRIKLRYPRNPNIGDKFSSRHGQKGVVSVLWPHVDMPFSESGVVPDIIINPHSFPSRMTIGMLVESMSGKSGAIHGLWQDATTFSHNENYGENVIDDVGQQLRYAGYNYCGNEVLYSGLHGTQMKADIFIGVVYYQRLRHMVNDKYQVRARSGPINQLTRQPIKGRKVGGGIRFGEMERDSMLAHGTAFLLQDRLFHCSDKSEIEVCTKCGSMLGIMPTSAIQSSSFSSSNMEETNGRGTETDWGMDFEQDFGSSSRDVGSSSSSATRVSKRVVCAYCETQRLEEEARKKNPNEHEHDKDDASQSSFSIGKESKSTVTRVSLPYSFKYLACELASMNVKINIHMKDVMDDNRE